MHDDGLVEVHRHWHVAHDEHDQLLEMLADRGGERQAELTQRRHGIVGHRLDIFFLGIGSVDVRHQQRQCIWHKRLKVLRRQLRNRANAKDGRLTHDTRRVSRVREERLQELLLAAKHRAVHVSN